MTVTLAEVLALARFSVERPREGARAVLAMNLPMNARWSALMLMAVSSALLAHLGMTLLFSRAPEMLAELPSPLVTAAVQGVIMVLSVVLIHRIGRMRGGTGHFADALILVAWLQFILVVLQALQIVVTLVLPPLGQVVSWAAIALFFWLLTNFIAELHGFRSLGAVFLGIIGVLVGMSVALTFVLLAILGG